MAQRHSTAPQVEDPIEHQINETIDRLIRLLNVRRAELLNLVGEKRAAERLVQEIIFQLTEVQEQLNKDLRQNIFHPLKNRMIRKLECRRQHLTPP